MALVAALTRDAEVRNNEIEQVVFIELRIEDRGGGDALEIQPIQQAVEQGCLAGAHFTSEQNEPLAILDAIGEPRQRLLDLTRQEQITRVRIGVERVLSQSEERFVH